MDKELANQKHRKHWTLRKEKRAQMENAKTLGVDDKTYKPTLDAVEQMTKIRNMNWDIFLKGLQIVGTLALGGLVAKAAYGVDKSDEILKNKNSMGLFGKVFRL